MRPSGVGLLVWVVTVHGLLPTLHAQQEVASSDSAEISLGLEAQNLSLAGGSWEGTSDDASPGVNHHTSVFIAAKSAGSKPNFEGKLTYEMARLCVPGGAQVIQAGFNRATGPYGRSGTRVRLRMAAQISPSIRLVAGRDTLHDGYGLRSLFRGGHAAPVPFCQTEINGGRLTYRHRIQALSSSFAVSHRLELAVGHSWKFALWGAVIWPTEGGSGRWFEPHYLVPIAAFRPTEYSQGSSDNAMVGGEFRFNLCPKRTLQRYLYGQFILDELLIAHLTAGDHWWGNQWGLLGGLHWGYKSEHHKGHLRAEISAVRPFTYAHTSGQLSWVQGPTPLAHPLGAHFAEAVLASEHLPKSWSFHTLLTGSTRGTNGGIPADGDTDRLSDTAPWFDGASRELLYGRVELGRKINVGSEQFTLYVAAVERRLTTREYGVQIGLRSGAPLRALQAPNW